jgi:hypothetical protein
MPLADHGSAPVDLFTKLFEFVDDYLSLQTPDTLLEHILNDPVKAHEAFLAIKGTDFAGETGIADFLEDAHGVVADYDIPGYADFYAGLVRAFLLKYNVRYRLDDPFKLRFLLPGSFMNLYGELQRLNVGNPHLVTLMEEFEHAFDQYARSLNATDLKTCIARASNYAEGLACAVHGQTRPNTLGVLCNTIGDWPHDKVRDGLKNLYHFCSDYPGIRHAGTAANARRTLDPKDSTLICLLLMAFSGYLSPQLDAQSVLGAT